MGDSRVGSSGPGRGFPGGGAGGARHPPLRLAGEGARDRGRRDGRGQDRLHGLGRHRAARSRGGHS